MMSLNDRPHCLNERPGLFVNAADHIPDLVIRMAYAGSDNFVGTPIAGYRSATLWLTRPAVDALAHAQGQLRAYGLTLCVFDGYRPVRAVQHFLRWAEMPCDDVRRARFYPRIDKQDLFQRGYLARQSSHSRGSTVDLTLACGASHTELDMGTAFDVFDVRSHTHAGAEVGITTQQRANRLLLGAVMAAAGFDNFPMEWWHFTLRDEPFRACYFDFPIDAAAAGDAARPRAE